MEGIPLIMRTYDDYLCENLKTPNSQRNFFLGLRMIRSQWLLTAHCVRWPKFRVGPKFPGRPEIPVRAE